MYLLFPSIHVFLLHTFALSLRVAPRARASVGSWLGGWGPMPYVGWVPAGLGVARLAASKLPPALPPLPAPPARRQASRNKMIKLYR